MVDTNYTTIFFEFFFITMTLVLCAIGLILFEKNGKKVPVYSLTAIAVNSIPICIVYQYRAYDTYKSYYGLLNSWFLVVLLIWIILVKAYRYRTFKKPLIGMRILLGLFLALAGVFCFLPEHLPYLCVIIPVMISIENYYWCRSIFTSLSSSLLSACQFAMFYYLYYS